MKNYANTSMKLTGLLQLTQEQLINIILRKDDLEKQLSAEVKKLHKTNRQLTELIEEMDSLMNK